MNANDAAIVLAPYEGEITVTSVTAGSASAAIVIGNAVGGAYVTIAIDDGAGAEVGAYLTARALAAPTNPAPTATTGGGRTMWVSAGALRSISFRPGDQIKVFVPGSGTYYVRQYRSSP
jgi:hypothetical protein